jgi:hypothetical protein
MPDRTEMSADVRMTETPDGTILLDTRRSTYYRLNATGSWCLAELLRGASPEEIRSDIVHRTGADPQVVARDVADVVADLVAKGLIRR